jgi:hypothetical protein
MDSDSLPHIEDGAMTDTGRDDHADQTAGTSADDEHQDDSRPAQRFEQQTLWVDAQIRNAMARGDFDNLPGAGKPIEGLGGTHDPDWWVKGLIKRENITGLGPPAITLRKEDAELDARLDRIHVEGEVRRILEDFNARVVSARRQLQGGPPVVTPTRDVDAEVEAWKERRAARVRERTAAPPSTPSDGESGDGGTRQRRWWRRRR